MRTINLYDAKTHLSQLVDRAAGGEEIIIGKNGKPLVKMVAYTETSNVPRIPGSWKGRVTIHANFDDLPPDVAEAFAGEAP